MAERKTPRRAGAIWREESGKLIEWTTEELRVTVLWPKPRCWLRLDAAGSDWREMNGRLRPEAWYPLPEEINLRPVDLARRAAYATIPVSVREAIDHVGVVGMEWSLLSMLARCPGALELCQSVPLLAGALSVANHVRTIRVARPLRSIRRLLALPDGMDRWRKIAGWLGFEPSASFVKVMRRMPREVPWARDDFRMLQRVWDCPKAKKRLRHLPRIDRGVVELLDKASMFDSIDRLSPALLEAAYTGGGAGGVAWHYVAAAEFVRAVHPEAPLPIWRSVDELYAQIGAINDYGFHPIEHDDPFPPPPFAGTAAIIPLCTPEALAAEGTRMFHCLGLYGWQREARDRIGFAYRVESEGEQATLWVRRSRERPDMFHVGQFRGPRNAAPSAQLTRLVARWLIDQQLQLHQSPNNASLPPEWRAPPAPPRRYEAEMGDDIPF